MGFRIDDLSTLDPAAIHEFTGLEYAAQVYQRLVKVDGRNLAIVGDAAASWSLSTDRLKYTFKLKPQQKFASGHALTATDVVFSLQRAVKLAKAPASHLLQLGLCAERVDKQIKMIDAETLELNIDKPYATEFVLYCLSLPVAAILDSKILRHESLGETHWLQNHSAGSGPYQLYQWTPNQFLKLTANPHYGGAPAHLPKIFIRHIKEAATQHLLFNKGDLDIARNLTAEQLADIKGYSHTSPKAWLIYLGLNQADPLLAKPAVQQALRYLIDYHNIATHLLSSQVKVHQSIIPQPVQYDSSQTFKLDIQRAKSLLEEAGLARGFELNLDTTQIELATALQNTFAQAGIKLNILSGNSKQVLQKYRARKHQLFLGNWGADYPDPQSSMTFVENTDDSDQGQDKTIAWRNHWRNTLKADIDEALVSADPVARAQRYATIASAVSEASPIIVMFQRVETSALSNSIKGFAPGPSSDTTLYAEIRK